VSSSSSSEPHGFEAALLAERDAMGYAMREGMCRLAGGVVVVTNWIEGRPWGTTVSSCTSVSMDPPLLLACLVNGAISTRAILEQGCFGINILGADQTDIALRAGAPGKPKFIEDIVRDEIEMGTPVISNAVVAIHCELYNSVVVGDHTIFIGQVGDVTFGRGRSPLVFFNRQFYDLLEHLS
jgi:flavin reductase (DIM6/NTAB) family NADH-FMN oxidoreductase RutF